MTRLGQLVAAAVLALGASAVDDGQSILTSEIGRQNNQSLLWGPYKPNLYFGVRPRLPDGLWTGLMWGGVNTFEEVPTST
jgi:mannosyl-oligosaccharide glucosidase